MIVRLNVQHVNVKEVLMLFLKVVIAGSNLLLDKSQIRDIENAGRFKKVNTNSNTVFIVEKEEWVTMEEVDGEGNILPKNR